jgi:UDP-N-acetylmuramate--alanine ligase
VKNFPIGSNVVHFVGIGGIGMSGIADILVNLGYKVSGSDLRENPLTARLSRKGVAVSIGHRAENVHGSTVVVSSSAIAADNPEILEARRRKIPVVRRAEMLAELMKMKRSVAVAGTHGKTTTTSLIGALLEQANLDPTVVNGGVVNAYNSNARLGFGEWIVVEADESDGSFTKLASTVAVVTNINLDHINNFKDFSELRGLFLQFVENIPFYGAAILCLDHPEVKKIADELMDRRVIGYGLAPGADVCCENIRLTDKFTEFDVVLAESICEKYGIDAGRRWEKFQLSMFGIHNVQNALAAIAVGLELGISEENMRAAFGSFMGVKRRFTKVADVNGVTIVDDYAHHPVEISAVLNAARQLCRGKIYAVIQPHRYTRLQNFLPDFATVLELSDGVLVTAVYPAGEQCNGVDHLSLLNRLKENAAVPSEFVADVQKLREKINGMAAAGDFVIFLGAGDITQWAYGLAEMLQTGADKCPS